MKSGLSFRKKKVASNIIKLIWTCIFGSIISIFLGVAIAYGFGLKKMNVGLSMQPSLVHGQEVLVNRFHYLMFTPKNNDIIVFSPTMSDGNHVYLKRIVAVPGDSVQIIDGYLFVNGVREKEGFDKMAEAGIAAQPLILNEDEFFALGDNRNFSEDSRSKKIGIIHRDNIIGKAWFSLGKKGAISKFI